MQEKRKQREEEGLLEAAALKAAHEKRPENKGIAYNPAEDKFVLTLPQIEQWIRCQKRRRMAGLQSKIVPAIPDWTEKLAA